MPPPGVTLRPITASDAELLYRIYASTRTEELANTGWSDAQQEAFLRMQFHAQRTHYEKHTPNAAFLVIERSGEPVGRLYVDRRESAVHVVDIALLPKARGSGIGEALLRELQEEAAASGRVVSIWVERMNRARRLYERLGFREVPEASGEERGVYLKLEWRAR